MFVVRFAVEFVVGSFVVLFVGSVEQQFVVVRSAVVRFVWFAIVPFVVVLSVLIAVGSFELFGNVPK